ncbi:MAG: ATP-binding protein [Bacteroidales bacterium]
MSLANKPIIDKATRLLEKASYDVRRISHNMMPGILSKYGLFEAVAGIFDEIDGIDGLHTELDITGDPMRFNENKEIMMYRVIQEMINNSLKHAEPKNIFLAMHVSTDKIAVKYRDNGKGFDVEEKMKLKSFGLNNIISRVKFLGGDLKIESEVGNGVECSFEVPVRSAANRTE